MGQVLQADSIATISVTSATVITMAATTAQTIGGGQFPTSQLTCTTTVSGAGGLDTGSIAANTLYYLYLVKNFGIISLVASISATSPTGFAAYKRIGRAATNASSQWQAAGNNVSEDTGKVGQVLSAMLSETQFKAIHGSSWVLADGRSVAGSTYAIVTGITTVPDLRSVVLRGKDNGRGLNPDGDYALGTYQGDMYASHNHTLVYNPTGGGGGGGDARMASEAVPNTSSTTNILASGGNETRMKNVTVNHFIKIN